MMVSYIYVWNNGNIVPIVFQVHQKKDAAIKFYGKLKCSIKTIPKTDKKKNKHPFHALDWGPVHSAGYKAKNTLICDQTKFGLVY